MDSKEGADKDHTEDVVHLRALISELEKREIEIGNALEALRESEERFRIVADWTYDWEYWADPDGNLIYMSPSCERVTGYRPEQFVEDPNLLRSIVHPEDADIYEDLSQWGLGATEGLQERQEEFRIIARDGREEWIDHICRLVFTDEGRYLGRRASNRQVTDRKRAEEALIESEERFRSIFEHSLDGILLGAPDGTMLKANSAACSMLGMSEAEICNVGRDGLIDREDSRWADFLERRDTLGGLRGELNLERKNGTKFTASISMTVFESPDGGNLSTFIIRDITERMKTESALKEKTSALERSNKDLEQFAFVAAHDLREPLVGVAAYLKLLERRMGRVFDPESRGFLSKAINTIVRMDFLIQSLLAYSRITADTEELQPTDLNWCLSQALENLRAVINESEATVTSDPLPTLPVRQSQFIRVFQNLIGNAIKFRGTRPLKVHVGFHLLESDYQFSVMDNGLGIEPPNVDRIFNLFQRAHESSEFSGTGIGLASCKSIVKKHGGRIWVDSEPGKGSTFFFTLPRN